MTDELYPFLFTPVYKDYIWGGERIGQLFQRDLPSGVYAESWELSDREEGVSIVENGAMKGQSLNDLVVRFREQLVGQECNDSFPLLVKLIDAKENLSLQVHPDLKAAAVLGGEPKSECWYVLDALPDAAVYVGFRSSVDEKAILKALKDKTFKDLMRRIKVRKGDVVSIPAGRVHAIGAGCLMLEVQQNSNTTYRLFDWDRLGKDGQARQLHLEKGMRAIHWDDRGEPLVAAQIAEDSDDFIRWHILTTEFFALNRWLFFKPYRLHSDGGSFLLLFAEEGELLLQAGGLSVRVPHGRSCLIPAACTDLLIEPVGKQAAALAVTLA
jgi:mannose-6-phosphate isomerase